MSMRFFRNLSAALLLSLCVVTIWSPRLAIAAPGGVDISPRLAAQNVDWMSSEQASQLDLGFTVLVPSWIPGPFGGSPSVQASGGYYSLYWMNGGGSPTFLLITGEVGGGLPAGSPADLNNQLSVNASVQGYDAIHDVTSIYDNVWWVAGGVLYTVSANNMTGTDSLSLANSLIALEPPVAAEPTEEATEEPTQVATEEPTEVATETPTETATEPATETPTVAPDSSADPTGSISNSGTVESGGSTTLSVNPSEVGTLRTTDGYFLDSGQTFIADLTGGDVAWQAPEVDVATEVQFTLLDAQTGDVTASSSITVVPASGGEPVAVTETQSADVLDDGTGGSLVTPSTLEAPAEAEATQTATSGGTNGAPLSDGTAGPRLPPGSDGTGGIRQVTLP
jgi:hypothetical protein